MNQIISPSRLAIKALGLDLCGSLEAKKDMKCAVCGGPIHAGEPLETMKLPSTFTNQNELANCGGEYRCGACVVVMSRMEFLRALASGLFNRDGFYPINKKEHRSWAFQEGIEPPFVMTVQVSKSQHTIWRSPVSLSKNLIYVGMGDQVLKIRKEKLLAARDVAIRLNELRKPAAGRPTKGQENPFVNEWKMKSSLAGILKDWAVKILDSDEVGSEAAAALKTLSTGEIWALTAVLASPVSPEQISL